MSLKQSQGCRHLRCSDCGDIEGRGYWLTTKLTLVAPVWVHETMKAAARRHIKENHMGENSYNGFKTIDEGVSELMYMQQCIDWRVEE